MKRRIQGFADYVEAPRSGIVSFPTSAGAAVHSISSKERCPSTQALARVVLAAAILASGVASAATTDEPAASPAATRQLPVHARRRAARAESASQGVREPALRSNSALVLDESSDAVLLSKHADVATPIASITKLMTALVVLEAGQPLYEKFEVTEDDAHLAKPTASRLTVGTELTRSDFLHLALMASENRAAHALARNYPGGLAACIAAMNAKAADLGMAHTHFIEPTGLSSENVASPEDLSKLVVAASKVDKIQAYSTGTRYLVPVGKRMLEYRNTDALVSNPGWDIIVQKTGYIAEAGKCLVLEVMIEGRAIVMVLLDSADKQTRLADAQRVRRWMQAQFGGAGSRLTSSRT